MNINMIKIERWKPVKGYEGMYEVSNQGRIRSLYTGKIRKTYRNTNKDRYTMITLCNGVNTTFLLHRLVAIAFKKNPKKLPCVNHNDGDKSNNWASNLSWVTFSENEQHSYLKLHKRPYNTIITPEQAKFIYKYKLPHGQRKALAKKFNVSEATIKAIRTGRNHSQATKRIKL